MSRIRNHGIGAALTAAALAAVVITGCGNPEADECDDQASSMSMVMKPRPGGSSGGGGSRPNMTKPKPAAPVKPGSKAKAPKVHIDDEDCD